MTICIVMCMSKVTRILRAVEHGDPEAAQELLPLVYEELRRLAAEKMAHEKPGQTLRHGHDAVCAEGQREVAFDEMLRIMRRGLPRVLQPGRSLRGHS